MKVPKMYKSSDRYNAGVDVIYDDDSKLQFAPFIYATAESGDNGADDGGDEEGEEGMIIHVDENGTTDVTYTQLLAAVNSGKVVYILSEDIIGDTAYGAPLYLSDFGHDPSNVGTEYYATFTSLTVDTENNNNNNGPTGGHNANQNTSIPTVEEGQAVNDSTLTTNISTIDDATQIKLIEFLTVNKISNISINELLFDSKNAITLVALLKKFYGDANPTTSSIADATVIQKALINKLFSSSSLPPSISDSTILVAKKYLTLVAKNNNITVGDLLIDSKNNTLLSNSLLQVYDGDALSQFYLTENEIQKIREYMENVAKTNNSTVEALIQNPTKFL